MPQADDVAGALRDASGHMRDLIEQAAGARELRAAAAAVGDVAGASAAAALAADGERVHRFSRRRRMSPDSVRAARQRLVVAMFDLAAAQEELAAAARVTDCDELRARHAAVTEAQHLSEAAYAAARSQLAEADAVLLTEAGAAP